MIILGKADGIFHIPENLIFDCEKTNWPMMLYFWNNPGIIYGPVGCDALVGLFNGIFYILVGGEKKMTYDAFGIQ